MAQGLGESPIRASALHSPVQRRIHTVPYYNKECNTYPDHFDRDGEEGGYMARKPSFKNHFIIEGDTTIIIAKHKDKEYEVLIDTKNIQIPNPTSIYSPQTRRSSWEGQRKNLFFRR